MTSLSKQWYFILIYSPVPEWLLEKNQNDLSAFVNLQHDLCKFNSGWLCECSDSAWPTAPRDCLQQLYQKSNIFTQNSTGALIWGALICDLLEYKLVPRLDLIIVLCDI